MELQLVFLITIALLSSCHARYISQSDISSILQDIMSPTNTDKAMQIVNMAATRANKRNAIPDIAGAMFVSSDCGMPARIVAHELPVSIDARRQKPGRIITNEMGLPHAIITNDGVARVISSEPRIFTPEMGYPVQRNVVREAAREYAPANLIDSLFIPKEIYQPVPVAQESVVYPYRTLGPAPYLPVAAPVPSPYLPAGAPAPSPYLPVAAPTPSPSMPFGASNLYLPTASPSSAMSPSCLPLPTQSRGRFLRKIPIPPPTL